MNLGEKIIGLRKREGMTQEELASKLNVSRQTISKWELSQSNPELGYIVKLSELFGVTTDYLIREEDTQENINSNDKENNQDNQKSQVSYTNTKDFKHDKNGLSTRQIAGIVVASLGGLLAIISIIMLRDSGDWLLGILTGIVTAVVGFELLLIKKNAGIKVLWTIWCIIAIPMGFFLVNMQGNPFNLNTAAGIMACISLVTFVALIIATIIKIKKNTSDD